MPGVQHQRTRVALVENAVGDDQNQAEDGDQVLAQNQQDEGERKQAESHHGRCSSRLTLAAMISTLSIGLSSGRAK